MLRRSMVVISTAAFDCGLCSVLITTGGLSAGRAGSPASGRSARGRCCRLSTKRERSSLRGWAASCSSSPGGKKHLLQKSSATTQARMIRSPPSLLPSSLIFTSWSPFVGRVILARSASPCRRRSRRSGSTIGSIETRTRVSLCALMGGSSLIAETLLGGPLSSLRRKHKDKV